jgi:hypothetical protein
MAEPNPPRTVPLLAFWAAATIAFVAAIMPLPVAVPGAPSDKVQHFIAFLALAVLARWAYPEVRKRYLLLGLAAYGAAIELVQAIPALGRDSDPLDWIADVAAAAAVFVLIAIWPSFRRR